MSKYYIKTITNIYQDNYEEGEGKFVNQYDFNGVIEAKNAKRAIDSFLKEELYFENGYYDKETKIYTTTVDKDNIEVDTNSKQWEDFKSGKVVLYISCTDFEVYKLTKII